MNCTCVLAEDFTTVSTTRPGHSVDMPSEMFGRLEFLSNGIEILGMGLLFLRF